MIYRVGAILVPRGLRTYSDYATTSIKGHVTAKILDTQNPVSLYKITIPLFFLNTNKGNVSTFQLCLSVYRVGGSHVTITLNELSLTVQGLSRQ